MRSVFVSVVFLIVFVNNVEYTFAKKKEIPSFVHLCSRDLNQDDLNDCIAESIESIRPRLGAGVPDMYMPPLEPLVIPSALLDQGDTFRAHFSNLEVFHVTDFELKGLDFNIEENRCDMDLVFPVLRIRSQYNISGNILILQLQGHGLADGNITNIGTKAILRGQKVEKNGKEYINFDDNKLELNITEGHLIFDDLFKNNKVLTDAANSIINTNIKAIIDEIKPILVETIETIVFGIVTRVFLNYPLDELFP